MTRIQEEELGYHMAKNYDDMLSHFHLILEHHGQTDRTAVSISRVSMLTLDKKFK